MHLNGFDDFNPPYLTPTAVLIISLNKPPLNNVHPIRCLKHVFKCSFFFWRPRTIKRRLKKCRKKWRGWFKYSSPYRKFMICHIFSTDALFFQICVEFWPIAKSIEFEIFTLLPIRYLLTLNDLNLIRCWKNIIEHIGIVPEDLV